MGPERFRAFAPSAALRAMGPGRFSHRLLGGLYRWRGVAWAIRMGPEEGVERVADAVHGGSNMAQPRRFAALPSGGGLSFRRCANGGLHAGPVLAILTGRSCAGPFASDPRRPRRGRGRRWLRWLRWLRWRRPGRHRIPLSSSSQRRPVPRRSRHIPASRNVSARIGREQGRRNACFPASAQITNRSSQLNTSRSP